MTDTTLVFKVTVLGSILATVLGQNYVYPNARVNPRRIRPFFVQQPVAQTTQQRRPAVFFVGGNQFAAQPGPYVGGALGANRFGAQPSPYVGGAVGTNRFGAQPSPYVGGAVGPLPVGSAPGRAPFTTGMIGGIPIQIGPGIQQLVTGTGNPTNVTTTTTTITPTLSTTTTTAVPEKTHSEKMAELLFKVINRNHELRMMHTTTTTTTTTTPIPASEITGDPRGTHTHSFLHGESGNQGNSQVIVHSHGKNHQPHVHISHSDAVQPTNNGNTHQTVVPNVLSAAPGAKTHSTRPYNNQLPAPNPQNQPPTYHSLPQFLTGANEKTVVSRQVNTTLFRPTSIPDVPVRKQILPPSSPTTPTQPKTVFEDDEEDDDDEEEASPQRGSTQRQSITQLTPPNSQIPAPLPMTTRQPTTSQEPRGTSASTTSSASTPTTVPGPSRISRQL